ncbi:hypothetical protein BDV26DRAFT_289405 [Aspergillus bertholletiae]|uniref:Uncharacterized protein n=1 Tax=Aspergillus bertholletiae TaxID=1226010 RepID=A0A5N7BIL7_9EURO|nr:hypothetical protein BDV26DRAFT_289405 [Aspergillus bertholletiae]
MKFTTFATIATLVCAAVAAPQGHDGDNGQNVDKGDKGDNGHNGNEGHNTHGTSASVSQALCCEDNETPPNYCVYLVNVERGQCGEDYPVKWECRSGVSQHGKRGDHEGGDYTHCDCLSSDGCPDQSSVTTLTSVIKNTLAEVNILNS